MALHQLDELYVRSCWIRLFSLKAKGQRPNDQKKNRIKDNQAMALNTTESLPFMVLRNPLKGNRTDGQL